MKIIFQILLISALSSSAWAAGKKPVFSDFNAPPAGETNAPTVPANTAEAPLRPAVETPTTPPAPSTDLASTLDAAAQYESGQSLEPLRRLEEAVRQSAARPQARKELEQGLIKLLGTNSTFEARRFAAKQLGIIGNTSALPTLGQLLQDEQSVDLACLALTTYPPGKADETLRTALKFAPASSRAVILNTLGDRKDKSSVSILAHAATDADLAVAEAAVASLGKIGTTASIEALRNLPAERKNELKNEISEALLRFAQARLSEGDESKAVRVYRELFKTSDSIAVRRAALPLLLKTDADGGERRILQVLESKDEALKPVVIQQIPSVPGHSGSEAFGRELHHLSPANAALLLEGLAQRNDDAARLELAKALSSPEPIVRRAAIVALGRLGDPYFVSLLARAANTGEAEETKDIENALLALKGGAETDEKMIAELKHSMPKARVPLIGAVARRSGAAANPVLLEEVTNSDPGVAKAALRALGKTGGANEATVLIGKLSGLKDSGVHTEAVATASHLLVKIPDQTTRLAAVKEGMDKCTTAEMRLALFELLPVCGGTNALVLLVDATHDAEPSVKEAAVRALAEWPDDAAWDALLGIYQQPEADSAAGLALRGMVRMLDQQSTKPDDILLARYRQLFANARSEADLKLLLGSISNVPDPDALSLVVRYMSHATTQREAAAAAANIVETIKTKRPDVMEEAQKRLQAKPVAPAQGAEPSAILN